MWIYLRVATDVLPLLVNTCSSVCVAEPPDGARDYIPTPHKAESTSRHPTGTDSPAPPRPPVHQEDDYSHVPEAGMFGRGI